jgi:cytochrome c556
MRKISLVLMAAMLPVLGTCMEEPTATAQAPAAPPTPFNPVASVHDIMAGTVAPAADAVWGAVAVRSTANGLEESAPETDEDWAAVRYQALHLVEAANLLMMEGRQVALPGQDLLDAGLEGNLTADQIQTAMQDNRTGFIGFAQAFQNAAMQSLAAIDARDTAGLSDSGGGLDEACENCHLVFWYPESQ